MQQKALKTTSTGKRRIRNICVYCGSNAGTNPAYALTSATYFPAWSGDDNTGSDVAVLNTRPTLGGCSNITTFSQWG